MHPHFEALVGGISLQQRSDGKGRRQGISEWNQADQAAESVMHHPIPLPLPPIPRPDPFPDPSPLPVPQPVPGPIYCEPYKGSRLSAH